MIDDEKFVQFTNKVEKILNKHGPMRFNRLIEIITGSKPHITTVITSKNGKFTEEIKAITDYKYNNAKQNLIKMFGTFSDVRNDLIGLKEQICSCCYGEGFNGITKELARQIKLDEEIRFLQINFSQGKISHDEYKRSYKIFNKELIKINKIVEDQFAASMKKTKKKM